MTTPITALSFVRSVWHSFLHSSGLEPRLLHGVIIHRATPGLVRFSLPIEAMHTNRLSILHGGTIASMVDLGGSLAVASRGLFSTGVSTDINVTYLASGGNVGDVIFGESRCDRFGKTLAFTEVVFWAAGKDAAQGRRGKAVARGSHTKFVGKAWADERNCVEEMRREEEEIRMRAEEGRLGKGEAMDG